MFGRSKPKRDESKKWVRDLKKEMRQIDRDMAKIQREEQKIKQEIKRTAKRGQKSALKTLARGLVRSENHRARMLATKAQINSAVMSIQQAQATAKVVGHMQTSAQVMKSMNKLVKLPQIAATCRSMQQEMMKAGIIEEMVDDTFEMVDPENLDEEADQQIDKVLGEILGEQFSTVGAATSTIPAAVAAEEVQDADDEKEMAAMKARLAQLNAL